MKIKLSPFTTTWVDVLRTVLKKMSHIKSIFYILPFMLASKMVKTNLQQLMSVS